MKEAGLDEAEPPQLYLPYRQWPMQAMTIVLQTAVSPASVADAANRAVYATDPNMPVANVRTLEQIVARSISQPRFYTILLGRFCRSRAAARGDRHLRRTVVRSRATDA